MRKLTAAIGDRIVSAIVLLWVLTAVSGAGYFVLLTVKGEEAWGAQRHHHARAHRAHHRPPHRHPRARQADGALWESVGGDLPAPELGDEVLAPVEVEVVCDVGGECSEGQEA